MPTEPTSATADAGTAPNTTPEGVTPAEPMTADRAREILRNASKPQGEGKDPLTESPEGEDPLLTNAHDAESDPLSGHEAAEEPAESETAETKTETPAGETPAETAEAETEAPVAEAVPAAETEEPTGRKRLNIFRKNAAGEFVYNARERAAMQFADEEGIGFIDSWTRLYGDLPKSEAAVAKEVEKTEAKPEPTAVEIQAQILALRAQRKEASANLDQTKANEITEQIEDLIDAKNVATQREAERGRAKQTAGEQLKAAQSDSMVKAGTMFPDAIKNDSPLYSALTVEIAKLEKSRPEFFSDPEWPEALTAKLAARLGIAPATVKAPAKAESKPAAKPAEKPAAKVAPKAAARPAPSPGGIPAPARQANEQDLRVRIEAARSRNDIPALQALIREAKEVKS